jgi:hypothetical protein
VIPAPPHNFRQVHAHDKPRRLVGWLDDGSPILERPTDDLETFSIVPAPAGWYVLQWYDGDDELDEERICRTAIIAWRVCLWSGLSHDGKVLSATSTLPITADCADWSEMDHWVLGPDDLVYRLDYSPQMFDQWVAWQKRQLAEKRREKPELKAA